ncbi:MAG TPA: TonB-dependent receptor plug domain-containing protein, partial [Gammaproteobacteria bacterium]
MCALLMAAPTSSARDLLEIEITSGVRAESKVEVPAQITVISREDIMRSHHSSVSDVLRGKTGFQVTDLRGDGA